MQFKTVPITLITGYLGSGKTTLINHILKNANNHKIAVIVNDLGEVNIDAELIEKGGVVSAKDDNLVALQNGCICCTLKKDLLNQLADLVDTHKYDHILIEASGICEPLPIAQSILYMEEQFDKEKLPKFYTLDAIISVTDALRLKDEFGCGENLETAHRGEEDLENLIIQQIEFCDIVLLNKVDEVSKKELERIKMTIKALQPQAEIIETNYCKVDVDKLIDTKLFDFEKDASSATWIQEFESWENEHDEDEEDEDDHDHEHHHDDDDEEEEHEHHHHHHHHHHEHGMDENDDEGTADEYNVNTFVYYRRKPFNRDKFLAWVENNGRNIIRSKGIVYFEDEYDGSYVYESCGRQRTLNYNGTWYVVKLSQRQIRYLIQHDKNFAHDYDEKYGDRLIKLVFIGQNLDKSGIKKELDQF